MKLDPLNLELQGILFSWKQVIEANYTSCGREILILTVSHVFIPIISYNEQIYI